MKIENYNGDLLMSKADIIAHQTNCLGVMGSGVAFSIKTQHPRVFEQYRKAYTNGLLKLGMCQVVHTNPHQDGDRLVANLCGQEAFGGDKRHTSYEGIDVALEKLASYCNQHGLKSVAFPYKMSSDRGGADWNIIKAMIESVFKDMDITVEYWKL
jgi:O-acetyl-ADP-ribose deacetylase (regulator of RNase III)